MFLFIIFSVVTISTILWNRRKFYMLKLKIPGKWGYPIIGSALDISNPEKILPFLTEMKIHYGKLSCVFIGPKLAVIVSDPKIIEKVLTSTSCVNKSSVYESIKFYVGDGLVTSKHPKWSRHRKLLNPAFNQKILKSFIPIFNKEGKLVIGKLNELVGKKQVNIAPILHSCTLNCAFATTFGLDLKLQENQNVQIYQAYFEILKAVTTRIFQPWIHNDTIYKYSDLYRKNRQYHDVLIKLVVEIVDEKLNKLVQAEKSTDGKQGEIENNIFIDYAIKLFKEGNFNMEEVLNESNIVIAAAFDTFGTTLYFSLLCLAIYPQYQEILFDELKTLFVDKDFDVTYDDISQMNYLDMIINETLRLLPVIPIIGRQCSEDFHIGDEIILPKGTEIIIDILNTHRDKDIWGPNADIFYPDHFLKHNFSAIPSYGFIPFTKGIRQCIGSRYVLIALKVTLCQILRNFRFQTKWKLEDLEFEEDISLKLKEIPLLEVFRRD